MALNPVEQRMLDLCERWRELCTDASKRLVVWRVPANATRLIQCFFEAQKHDVEYATGDLFIVLDPAFENSMQYSRALKEALQGQYEASREDLARQGIAADWNLAAGELPDSARGVIEGLRSLARAHQQILPRVVAVLAPGTVDSAEAWEAWIGRALESGLPERLRILVVETREEPRLHALLEPLHPLACVDEPPLDALAVAQETFAQEAVRSPAGVFRSYLVALATLIEKDSADRVKAKAADAVAFARKQGWADQEVVVAMMVAGALLKEKRTGEAIEEYGLAREAAAAAAGAGHPAGKQLVLQTWFGQAGAELAAGEPLRAAECYEQAAHVAQQVPHPILAIEAFRMSAFCYARTECPELAYQRGLQALQEGRALEGEMRAMTTLPLAALDLLRVVEPERVERMDEIAAKLAGEIERAREHAEREAVELDSRASGHVDLEQQLAQQSETARARAEHAIGGISAQGSERFQQILAHARDLLGGEWPLSALTQHAGAGPAARSQGAAS